MFHLTKPFAEIENPWSQRGTTLLEVTMAVAVTLIVIMGAYGLVLAVGNHQRSSAAVADMNDYCSIAMERLFREISETSNERIVIVTTNVRGEDGVREDAISFASARDANGVFQTETYGALGFGRPVWQKAVVYCIREYTDNDGKHHKSLFRKEIPKTDWSSNYDPIQAIDSPGEAIAENADYMYFGLPYPQSAPVIGRQDHVLQVHLRFSRTREEMQAGPARSASLSTAIPIMNRKK
jgi:hypothetical protein